MSEVDKIIRATIVIYEIKSTGDTEHILRDMIEKSMMAAAIEIGRKTEEVPDANA